MRYAVIHRRAPLGRKRTNRPLHSAVSESAWLPTISATGSEVRNFGQVADVNGNIESGAQNSGDATANLTWTLYDFGARSGRIKSASRLLDAAAATASRVVQQTVSTVVQSYYGAVAGDAGLVAAKATETIAAHSLEIARALQTGGAAALGDVLQAQTAYEEAVLSFIQAEAAAKNAQGTLAVTLGGTADQPFRLAPEPVPTEVPALSARMADLMAEAARQRPDLAAAQAQRDSAEANITVAAAAGRPSISIGALHNFTSTTGRSESELQSSGNHRDRADLHRLQCEVQCASGAGRASSQ